MPTIHIQCDDSSVIANILAALGEGLVWDLMPQIVITLDASEVAAAIAAPATEPTHHPVVDLVVEAERDNEAQAALLRAAQRAAERTARREWQLRAERARKDYTSANWERLISFLCHSCGAVPGKPCRSASNKPYDRHFVHQSRHEALAGRPDRQPWPTTVPTRMPAIPLDEM